MSEYNNVRLALKCLMNGFSITINETTYRMSEDYDIVQEMEHYKIEDGEIKDLGKTYVPTYMTVASFASLCQMFTETDVAMMAATLAINKVD